MVWHAVYRSKGLKIVPAFSIYSVILFESKIDFEWRIALNRKVIKSNKYLPIVRWGP